MATLEYGKDRKVREVPQIVKGQEPAPDATISYRGGDGGVETHEDAVREARFFKRHHMPEANVFDVYEHMGDGPTFRVDLREEAEND